MRKYIVLISKDHYNPVGIIRTLGEAGINPVVVVVKTEPMLSIKSRYVSEYYVVNGTEEGLDIVKDKFTPDNGEKNFIFTGDDVTVETLDAHYDELKDHFYFYNCGEKGRLRGFMEKDAQLKLAEECGFNLPKTWVVHPALNEIPDNITYPVMTKAINSFSAEWKDIVYVCHDRSELESAFKKIYSETVLLQQYVEKVDEQSYEGFAINHGQEAFFSIQNNQVYNLPDTYTPFWKCTNCYDEDFMAKARKMLAKMRFEGIFEFEFMVGKDGKLYFLEMNVRNTANGWETTVAGMPGVTLWADGMINGHIRDDARKEIPKGFTAIAECWDYDARVKKGLISKEQWLEEYKSANAKFYKGRNDDAPFYAFMIHKLFEHHPEIEAFKSEEEIADEWN